MSIQIQLKRGLSTEWTSLNLVLAAGELGLETDTNKIKVGDGVTSWNSLSYLTGDSILKSDIDAKGEILAGTSSGPVALTVGSDNSVLQADSAQTTGLKYAKIVGNNIDTTTTITTSGFYHATGNTQTWYGTTASASSLPSAASFPANTILVIV